MILLNLFTFYGIFLVNLMVVVVIFTFQQICCGFLTCLQQLVVAMANISLWFWVRVSIGDCGLLFGWKVACFFFFVLSH